MASTYTEFATEPANLDAVANDAAHYNLPVYEWFGDFTNFPTRITPDLGDINTSYYSGSNNSDFTRKNSLFQTPALAANQVGFEIQKPSTNISHTALIEYRRGTGHWMPAPLFRSFSYYWKNHTNANSNWYVYSPGLTLINYKTNALKRWTAGWQHSKDANPSGRLYRLTGLNKAQQVNALGPDWYIVGAWFSLKSNATEANQSPRSELTDFRLGWHNPDTGSGATKLIIPNKMSWDDLRETRQRDEVSFYSIDSGTLDDSFAIDDSEETKSIATSASGVNDDTFCPLSTPGLTNWNKWTGNCRAILISKMSGENMIDYAGTYSNGTITFKQSNNDALIFKAKITKIEPSLSYPAIAELTVEKIQDNDAAWPENTNIDVAIEGLT